MARTTPAPLPPEVSDRAARLGERIRVARQRRKFRQSDVAARTGLARSTIEAVERGAVDTSLGAYLRVLWLFGMDANVDILADPSLDKEGALLEYEPGERRVRIAKTLDNDF